MIELLLSLGLFSMLLVGLLQLLDTTTDIWKRVEHRRERTEVSGAFASRLEHDLSTLEAGFEGDFLADWTLVDVDGNGVSGLALPRLRFVRRASPREVVRLRATQAEDEVAGIEEETKAKPSKGDEEPELPRLRADRGLVEVAWILLPASEKQFDGRLMRAERFLDDPERISLFDERLFGVAGRPPSGMFEEVSSDVLWMGMLFATQTTSTLLSSDGSRRWQAGVDFKDGGVSWDAWTRGRTDAELCDFNLPAAGMGTAAGAPILPRRVRIAFEVQSESDKLRRTTLQDTIEHDAKIFIVMDDRRLPEVGGHMLIDEEWIELLGKVGARVTVKRGVRGTVATPHKAGALLQYGWRTEVELPVAAAREDW